MGNLLTSLAEEALVQQCKEQLPYVQTGFEELVKRYEKKVFYLCKRYLSSDSEAEDASQEVFMKVLHALPSFDNRSAFTTWLFSIAMNHCKTILGKRKRDNERYEYGNSEVENGYEDSQANIDQAYALDDDKNCIQGAIQMMKPDERDMLLLRFTSELSLDDIAKVLGKKISATKMGFYRTLDKFKVLYEKYCL